MFCASLRRRPSFAPVCNHLPLTASGGLQENQLTTHDIAVPCGFTVDPRARTSISDRQLRILLFGPSAVSDTKLEATILRTEALLSDDGAEPNDVAIVFLLSPPRNTSFLSATLAAQDNGNDPSEGVQAYMKLQVELKNRAQIPPIAILPLSQLEGLPALVKKHALAASKRRSITAPPATNTFELLTHCSAQPPMREQTAYVCTDIFKDLREMAHSCRSISSAPASSSPSARAADGMTLWDLGEDYDTTGVPVSRIGGGPAESQKNLKMLQDTVGKQECQNVVDFWKEEFVME